MNKFLIVASIPLCVYNAARLTHHAISAEGCCLYTSLLIASMTVLFHGIHPQNTLIPMLGSSLTVTMFTASIVLNNS